MGTAGSVLTSPAQLPLEVLHQSDLRSTVHAFFGNLHHVEVRRVYLRLLTG